MRSNTRMTYLETTAKVARMRRVQQARASRGHAPIFIDTFVCILGFFSSMLLHFIGDFFVTEIVLIALLPFLVFLRGRRLLRPGLKTIFLLLGLWLFGLILSDAYHQTETNNRLRGTALIVFFAILIASFSILLAGNERRKTIFLTAYAVGSIVMAKVQPTEISLGENRWKFGYATGTIMLVLLISCYFYAHRRYLSTFLILAAIAGYNLLVNYRSAFLEVMLAAVLVLPIIPEQVGRLRLLPRKKGLAHLVVITFLTISAGWSASKVVSYASGAGYLGDTAKEKNEAEAKGGNLILGGRPEVFTGLRAVADSPIIGHGSWPQDLKYIEMQADLMVESGVRDTWEGGSGLIPSHSHIVGAMVNAGILGAPFWAYLLWLVARSIVRVAIRRPPLAPIYCYLLVTQFWATLFSPFGSTARIIEAATIVIILDLLEKDSPRVQTSASPLPLRKAAPASKFRSRRPEWKASTFPTPRP